MRLATTALIASMLTACGGSSSSDTSPAPGFDPCDQGYDCAILFAGVTDMHTATLATLVSNAAALETSATDYCDTVKGSQDFTAIEAGVKAAWKVTVGNWQRLEALQFGPIKTSRDQIYTWPLNSTCAVDQAVINAQVDGYNIANVVPQSRGLDALGYVLFESTLTHSCPSTTTKTVGWNDNTDTVKRTQRCEFAQKAAVDVKSRIAALQTDWLAYVDGFVAAGTAESSIASQKDALKTLSDALFYLDKEVKDRKVAGPAGISADCSTEFCADDVEFRWAEYSKEAVIANLQSFKAVFEAGFDDLLIALDGESVSTAMTVANQGAIDGVSAVPGSFYQVISNAQSEIDCINLDETKDIGKLCQSQADIKVITDQLKSQFLQLTSLSAPATAEGDND